MKQTIAKIKTRVHFIKHGLRLVVSQQEVEEKELTLREQIEKIQTGWEIRLVEDEEK